MEEKILKLMKSLEISREEAIELIAEDEEVDRMAMSKVDNDLTDEQKKASKKARSTGTKEKTEKVKRERKADEDKRFLIELLKGCVSSVDENLSVDNIEREINFKYNDRKFKIVLSAPRS